MLTLVTFPIPTGTRAWIEDVVVDGSARGQGAGEALTREAIRLAEAAGARTIDLSPARPAKPPTGCTCGWGSGSGTRPCTGWPTADPCRTTARPPMTA